MNKDKVIKLIGIFVLIVSLFTACNSDEPNPLPGENYEYNVDSVKDIALAIVQMQPSIEICKEVHAATQKAISLGLDESYYFVEMLGKGEKITKGSEINRLFLAKLDSLPQDDKIKQLFYAISDCSKYMRHYQIYWPYSQRWDGKEMPTITFKSKESPSIPQKENTGYSITNDGIEAVTVDEYYAQHHPVWIINYNPIPYEEYPDFSERNWVNIEFNLENFSIWQDSIVIPKHIIYSKEVSSSTIRPNYAKPPTIDLENDTLSLYLEKVGFWKKETQYHSLFSGGAHYIFNFEVIDINDINPADYKNYSEMSEVESKIEIVGVRFVFLRSEMTEGNEKILDSLLSWRWLNFEYSMPIFVAQEFGGEDYILLKDVLSITSNHTVCYVIKRGNFQLSLYCYELKPMRINDKFIYLCNYSRTDSGRMDNPKVYEDILVSDHLSFELLATKGATTPPWYTQVAK